MVHRSYYHGRVRTSVLSNYQSTSTTVEPLCTVHPSNIGSESRCGRFRLLDKRSSRPCGIPSTFAFYFRECWIKLSLNHVTRSGIWGLLDWLSSAYLGLSVALVCPSNLVVWSSLESHLQWLHFPSNLGDEVTVSCDSSRIIHKTLHIIAPRNGVVERANPTKAVKRIIADYSTRSTKSLVCRSPIPSFISEIATEQGPVRRWTKLTKPGITNLLWNCGLRSVWK